MNAHKVLAQAYTPQERDFLTLMATGSPLEQAIEASAISHSRASELMEDPETQEWIKRTRSIIESSYAQATVKMRMLLPRAIERMSMLLDNGSEKAVIEVCKTLVKVFYENKNSAGSPHGNFMVANIYSTEGVEKLKILSGDVIDI